MTTRFIPGHFGSIEINSVDFSVYGTVTGLQLTKSVGRRGVFGQDTKRAYSGQYEGTLSASGGVAGGGPIPALITAFDSEDRLAFELHVGEDGTAAIDAGSITGFLILSSLSVDGDAESGDWSWSIDGEVDGAITHAA